MASLVLTVIGDDRSGLVSALAEVIAGHGGNWERSQMSELAGKFAGIVLVTVPDQQVDGLVSDLEPLEAQGLLDVTVRRAGQIDAAPSNRLSLELIGTDRAGIVQEIARALAARNVSIEQLRTQTRDAPMAGGVLFEASATLRSPVDVSVDELRRALEHLADELMVEIALESD